MSYDLALIPDVFDADAIRAYFASRPHYRVDEQQAWYANEDTGVYFGFEFLARPEAEEAGDPLAKPHVAFSLNYFRPRIFALESEPEIAAFLARFPGSIHDPQRMENGPYSREGFLEGWNHGNRFAFNVMAQQGADRPAQADPARIEAVWEWNFKRAQLQAEAGERLFVPKIVWVRPHPDASPETAITWTFGVATAIPESLISRVVLVRQERPKLLKLFARNDTPKFEYKLIGVESGIRIAGIERGEIDGRAALFTPGTGPLEMQALFSGAWPPHTFKLVSPDEVMDADLVEAAT